MAKAAKKKKSAKKPVPARKAKPAPVKKVAAKAKKGAKPVAKSAKPVAKAAKPAKPAPPAKKKAAGGGLDDHPAYQRLVEKLKPGRHAGGMLLITEPGAFDRQMAAWLMGRTDGRRSLGRTAFGDIVVFRDLRARAKELGLPGAEAACDVAMVDVHHKRMTMLAESVDELLDRMNHVDWQRAFLRRDMYLEARKRIGDYGDDECYGFALALAMGGSEDAQSVRRFNWPVHLEILLQT